MMNKKVFETLEYRTVTAQLLPFIQTTIGAEHVAALTPTADRAEINHRLDETADGTRLDRWYGGIPIAKTGDLLPMFQRLRLAAVLSPTELAAVGKVVTNGQAVQRFFDRCREDAHWRELIALPTLVAQFIDLSALAAAIAATVDSTGLILDTASVELGRLRRKIVGHEQAIKDAMQQMTRGKQAQYLSDAIITIRNNRYVLPVKSEYRHQFGGVIHDQSQSGLTVYIEPAQMVAKNQELSALQVAMRAEEQRVCQVLSAELAESVDALAQNYALLGQCDVINAKARLARAWDAQRPTLSADQSVDLQQAWHPLLPKETAVPNDIQLGGQYRTLIITGPNTGGKTITIKTLGLLQLLAQSGLFITVRQPSTVAVFDDIFADIGDEQSISQNLSTFSSHMANILSMLPQITPQTLVIFDELGAGTDPTEGAALAMALLDAVRKRGACALVTTHYPELKLYADNRDDTRNGSMVFDVAELRPTYRFMMGIPGQSNALAIARRLGFPDDILAAAEDLVDDDSQSLNQMIHDLVTQRDAVAAKNTALTERLADVDQRQAELTQAQAELEQTRAAQLLTAKNEANAIVSQAKKQTDHIIKTIRQERLKGGQAAANEQTLKATQAGLNDLTHQTALERNKVLQKAKRAKQFAVGDDVLVTSYGQQGTLLKKHGQHQWEVEIGILKMVVDEHDLDKATAAKAPQKAPKTKQRTAREPRKRSVSTGRASASAKLDLRGQRYEAAVHELDRFLDSAVLANLSQVEIIHGKGTGALREAVTTYLRSDRRVQTFNFASANGGGDGATLVTLGD